jgi:hypothetical protein
MAYRFPEGAEPHLRETFGHHEVRHIDPVKKEVGDHRLDMFHCGFQVAILKQAVQNLCYELSDHQAVVSSHSFNTLHDPTE